MKVAKTKTLGSVISVSKGKKHLIVDKPSSSSKRLIGIDDLRNDNLLRYTDDSSGTAVVPDDVLIAWDGANAGTIGFGKKGYIGSTIARLRIDKNEKIYTPFLGVFLRSKFDYLRQTATGATIPHINRKALDDIALPEINFQDQIRIAHVLGKVEGLIAQRKQHLQQLDDLLKSIYLKMFGPGCKDYDIWPIVEIRDLAATHKGAMRTGPFGSNLLHSEFLVEGDVAVLGIDNAVQNHFAWGERRFISKKKYEELESYRVYPDDVIITIMGTIGRSTVVPSDIPLAINTKHLAAITLNKKLANPIFLSYSIHSSPFILNQFRSKNRGAIMSGLNLGLIKETKLKRPPVELQNKFSELHHRVDDLRKSLHKSLCNLELLYGTLSQKAFKGELDLSQVLPPEIELDKKSLAALIEIAPTTSLPNEIELPNTKLLRKELNNPRKTNDLLHFWLDSYCAQIGDAKFTAQEFMDAAQKRLNDWLQAIMEDKSVSTKQKAKLAELYPNNEIVLTSKDYGTIKKWIFDQLRSASLKQTRNKVMVNNRRQFGNEILIRPRMNKKQ